MTSIAIRSPSARQSEKYAWRRLISVTPDPSGLARMSGPARPVSKSSARKRIGPFAPGKVASAVAAAHAIVATTAAMVNRLRLMIPSFPGDLRASLYRLWQSRNAYPLWRTPPNPAIRIIGRGGFD